MFRVNVLFLQILLGLLENVQQRQDSFEHNRFSINSHTNIPVGIGTVEIRVEQSILGLLLNDLAIHKHETESV